MADRTFGPQLQELVAEIEEAPTVNKVKELVTLLARAKSQLRAGATQQAENALTTAFVKLLSVAQEKEHDASSHESTVKYLQDVMEALDEAKDLFPALAGCLDSAKVLYQKLALANKSKTGTPTKHSWRAIRPGLRRRHGPCKPRSKAS